MLTDSRSKNVGSGVDHYILTDIDDFQAADNRREAALNAGNAPQAASAAQDMANIICDIDGNLSRVRSQVLLQWASHLKRLLWRFSVGSDATAVSSVTEASKTAVDEIDPSRNILNIEGVIAMEFGLSLAKKFALL